nr:UDP-N-acetylmuramoyl-tripeptide--D-alanyl-D-alanine ligase [Armatimonadota bacterium]
MIPIPLRELAAACEAEAVGDWPPDDLIISVSSDTRVIGPHSLFVALKGERFDGHDFLPEAAARGASAAIVSTVPMSGPLPLLRVPDTLTALGLLGRHVRQVSGVRIVGVTGSVGKTTVKEMTALVLESSFHTLKSEANQNNEIGVPATLIRLESDHQAAVLEMGMRGPGEIQYLSEIAQPDAAIITNIGVAHIGRLGSRDAIAAAKAEIFVGMKREGCAILNRDDDYFPQLSGGAGRVLSFGMDARADIRACAIEDRGFG